MKDFLKVGVGIAIGYALCLGREKISSAVTKNFYKKFYGKTADMETDMEDEYKAAPDVIEVEMDPVSIVPEEPVMEEKDETGSIPESKKIEEREDA